MQDCSSLTFQYSSMTKHWCSCTAPKRAFCRLGVGTSAGNSLCCSFSPRSVMAYSPINIMTNLELTANELLSTAAVCGIKSTTFLKNMATESYFYEYLHSPGRMKQIFAKDLRLPKTIRTKFLITFFCYGATFRR